MKNLSVIIPVYKAEDFLERAIESVLIQNEVNEILLVEDNSPDNSLKICEEYVNRHPAKIKLYRHPNNANLGAAESRNLGMKNAKGDLIAFLDADDYYLPNRFTEALDILSRSSSLDGVYGAIGTDFPNEELKEKFKNEPSFEELATVKEIISPDDLFEAIAINNGGWIHLNTLTVKKSLLEKVGYFKKEFRQGQDTHITWKLAAIGKLKRQSVDSPIAMRGVHEGNRIHNKKQSALFHVKMVPDILHWGKDIQKIQKLKKDFISNKHILYLKIYAVTQSKFFGRFIYITELIKDPDNIIPKTLKLKELFATLFFTNTLRLILRNPFFFMSKNKSKRVWESIFEFYK